MASKSSKASEAKTGDGWTGRRADFDEFAARLAARKAELGNPELARNAGRNRTPSKRALLKAIEDAGGKW